MTMPKYRAHLQNVLGHSFGIVVDSDDNSWTSDPPGYDIPRSMVAYFTGGDHAIGSGKQFEIYPGGMARFVEDGPG